MERKQYLSYEGEQYIIIECTADSFVAMSGNKRIEIPISAIDYDHSTPAFLFWTVNDRKYRRLLNENKTDTTARILGASRQPRQGELDVQASESA